MSFHGQMCEVIKVIENHGKLNVEGAKNRHYGARLIHEGERSTLSRNQRNVMYAYEFTIKKRERIWE